MMTKLTRRSFCGGLAATAVLSLAAQAKAMAQTEPQHEIRTGFLSNPPSLHASLCRPLRGQAMIPDRDGFLDSPRSAKCIAMTLTPGLRKFALTVHLASAVGWIGAVVAYLTLGISAVTSQDAQTVRAAWIAMELTGWFVIVPLALAALLTGLVMSLGTAWGLFRHYWVLITLVLTTLSAVVLLLHMPTVSALADVAREADDADLGGLGGDLLHSGLGLVVLLVITVLNVYKPRGLTPYGWRKQHERRMEMQP